MKIGGLVGHYRTLRKYLDRRRRDIDLDTHVTFFALQTMYVQKSDMTQHRASLMPVPVRIGFEKSKRHQIACSGDVKAVDTIIVDTSRCW